MATQPEVIEFVLEKLGDQQRFTSRAMFGEYALYADGKVVALVCDDVLYVKITPITEELASLCEKGPAYPGSKDYYIVEESHIDARLAGVLLELATTIPAKKPKKKK